MAPLTDLHQSPWMVVLKDCPTRELLGAPGTGTAFRQMRDGHREELPNVLNWQQHEGTRQPC